MYNNVKAAAQSYKVDDEEFLRMLRYFYEKKGDPSCYTDWDEGRFMSLCPEAHRAWLKLLRAQKACDAAMAFLEDET